MACDDLMTSRLIVWHSMKGMPTMNEEGFRFPRTLDDVATMVGSHYRALIAAGVSTAASEAMALRVHESLFNSLYEEAAERENEAGA